MCLLDEGLGSFPIQNPTIPETAARWTLVWNIQF